MERLLDAMIELVNSTELNSVVIDIKDYSGKILYDSNVPLVNELKLEYDLLKNITSTIDKLHENGIYVIARQTVFQDPLLARVKPEWAIKATWGGNWYDHKGLAWVDPTQKEVWKYNVEIAKEAISFGFDEINFDYVRFPSDGNMSAVVYTNKDKRRYEVMHDFFHFLNTELSSSSAYISLDMFGYVMERSDNNDLSIGQRLADARDEVDYICPMMYPSHYPPGHLGLANPAAHPGAVIENGMKIGVPRVEGNRAKIRPWIQAFNIGAVYGAKNIRAQIDMVEKYSDGGWLLWNAANRYSSAGLKTAEQSLAEQKAEKEVESENIEPKAESGEVLRQDALEKSGGDNMEVETDSKTIEKEDNTDFDTLINIKKSCDIEDYE